MKKYFLLFFIVSITSNTFAQNIIQIPDLKKPHQIKVKNNKLYIFDEQNYELYLYDIIPFALNNKIGKKGEGQNDFKYLPNVFIQSETFACTDFTKTIWYSENGKISKTKYYTDFEDFDLNSEMLLIPAKENYLRITVEHDIQRRTVYLLDSEFKLIKKLYEGPFIWKSNEPVGYRTHFLSYKNLIFISDNQKGFYIEVFNCNGTHLYTIDKSKDIDRIQIADNVEKELFYPLLHHFVISNDKIYATTNKKLDNKNEMIILDLKGNIQERIFLPLLSKKQNRGALRFDLFDIDQEKLYEVIKDDEKGIWELHITRL